MLREHAIARHGSDNTEQQLQCVAKNRGSIRRVFDTSIPAPFLARPRLQLRLRLWPRLRLRLHIPDIVSNDATAASRVPLRIPIPRAHISAPAAAAAAGAIPPTATTPRVRIAVTRTFLRLPARSTEAKVLWIPTRISVLRPAATIAAVPKEGFAAIAGGRSGEVSSRKVGYRRREESGVLCNAFTLCDNVNFFPIFLLPFSLLLFFHLGSLRSVGREGIFGS